VSGAPRGPEVGNSWVENETLGARSKLIPRSPRTYQFEPTSNAIGLWLAGMLSGGAVPNRSAAEAGNVAVARPTTARDDRTFIGHPRIACVDARYGDASGNSGDQDLILI
jgi:hypothetical protein